MPLLACGFVPLAALALLAHKFHQRFASWRPSVLCAALVWSLAVTFITETLTLFRLFSFGWVLAAWLALVAVLVMMPTLGPPAIDHPPPPRTSLPDGWRLALVVLAVLVAAVGVTGLMSPPNTWDALTYHLPRVAHWIQNGGVVHYPTHIGRQLYLAPWAEFAITQLQVLSGGDRFANLIQWFAMLGSLVAVSLIAQQLGADARGQILAAVVCAAIPMGILQASGAQNDWVVSFWLACFVYFGVAFAGDRGGDAEAWWAGASLGIAILTKATAYIVALPFLIWTLASAWHRGRRWWRALAAMVLAVLVINLGHYARNLGVYGSPLGPGREGPFIYANEVFGPFSLVSNVLRNIALHLGTPDEGTNAFLERGLRRFHGLLHLDISDPKTTWFDTTFHLTPASYAFHEDYAGNPVHAALIAMSCLMLLVVPTLRHRLDLLTYGAALVVAFLVFAFYLKWQPWHSRLHLPLFVLWSPAIGVLWARYRRLTAILVAVLLILAIPWVVDNSSRPLLGPNSVIWRNRSDQYLSNKPELRESYVAAMRQVTQAGCSNIGLWIDMDAAEYPIWVLARHEAGGKRPRIEHVYVKNASVRSPLYTEVDAFDPCAILLIVAYPSIPATLPYEGSAYKLRFKAPPVNLFLRE